MKVGNHSVPNVAFGVATKYNYLVREPEEFGMPVDGKMGFTLLDSSGSVKRLIPSPMFGLVARASLPIMTILQKTYVSIQFSDINCEAYNNFVNQMGTHFFGTH